MLESGLLMSLSGCTAFHGYENIKLLKISICTKGWSSFSTEPKISHRKEPSLLILKIKFSPDSNDLKFEIEISPRKRSFHSSQ